MTDLWGPDEARVSRPVLREREGEVPFRHSPVPHAGICAGAARKSGPYRDQICPVGSATWRVGWPSNALSVVTFGDGGLRTLLKIVAESFAATSMGNTSSPSSKSISKAPLLDLEQSNHDCNPKSDSQSSD